MSEYIWWEKTVEYRFVAEVAAKGLCDFAAPLAGRHERKAGDAIFGEDCRLVLVEFKRDFSQIPTEETLFENYGKAKVALNEYMHHFIVFAELVEGEHPQLELWARRYFVPEQYLDGLDILQHGVSEDIFYAYLDALASHKKADGRGQGAGHVTAEAMSAVIAVSANGQVVGSISLYEYAPTLFEGPSLLLEPAPSFSPQAPGM